MERINEDKIREALSPVYKELPMICMTETPSTNELAKAQAKDGAPDKTLILAESQTHGKGQKGRSFFSPPGTGLYMSLILRPNLSPDKLSYLTPLAAVAVSDAIQKYTGKRPKIKWVNDLYLNRKKICGILAESSLSADAKAVEYVILGIGLNLKVPEGGFPPEIRSIAGAIYEADEEPVSVNLLAAKIIEEIFRFLKAFDPPKIMKAYREGSMLIGETVNIESGDGQKAVCVLDIDEEGALVVTHEDGTVSRLISGNVQIKLK